MDYFASLYSYKNVSVVLSFFSGPVKCLVPHHFISVCLIAVCYGFVISFLIFSSLFSINRVLYGSFGNRMKKNYVHYSFSLDFYLLCILILLLLIC